MTCPVCTRTIPPGETFHQCAVCGRECCETCVEPEGRRACPDCVSDAAKNERPVELGRVMPAMPDIPTIRTHARQYGAVALELSRLEAYVATLQQGWVP